MEGTRVTLARIRALVERAGESPDAVARRLDVPFPAVDRALAYYHENEEHFERLPREEEDHLDEARDGGDLVTAEEHL